MFAACRRSAAATPGAVFTLSRPQLDTLRMSLPLEAHVCAGGGALLEGNDGNEGVLVWVKEAADPAPLSIRSPDERDPGRHARVVIRYVTGGIPHGFALDSGAVWLRDSGGALSGAVSGGGLELPGALRVMVEGRFQGVPWGSDTVPCAGEERP